jgi:hypothetical protein
LLPLLEGDLEKLVDHFPPQDYYLWSVEEIKGVSSYSLVLIVRKFTFTWELCKDIKDNLVSSSPTIQVNELRFHLCLDDAQKLLESSTTNLPQLVSLSRDLGLPGKRILEKFVQSTTRSDRRYQAILGQSLFSKAAIFNVQFRGIQACILSSAIDGFRFDRIRDLEACIQSLPPKFEDLADEDRVGDYGPNYAAYYATEDLDDR